MAIIFLVLAFLSQGSFSFALPVYWLQVLPESSFEMDRLSPPLCLLFHPGNLGCHDWDFKIILLGALLEVRR